MHTDSSSDVAGGSRDGVGETPSRADATPALIAPDVLRAVAAWLELHPEFRFDGFEWPLFGGTARVYHFGTHSAEGIAALASSIGGRWDKDFGDGVDDSYAQFKLCQEIAPGIVAEIVTSRGNVCKRVVTGTKEITVSEPDPTAVAALPTVERTEVVETFEWECGPLLAKVTPDVPLEDIPW